MTAGITGIDHVVIGVADLDRAAAAYRKLGFTLSPRGLHSAAMGTANHTIMLQRDYFELLAVLAPTALNAPWRGALAAGEGILGLAASTPNAAAARSAWLGAGLSPGEPVAFSRPVERPVGGKTEARFEIVSLPSGSLPGMSLFACAHQTRDAVWLPALTAHPNSAVAIRTLTLSAPDPLEASKAWLRALPGAAAETVEGGMRIRSGAHRVDLVEAHVAAARYCLSQPLDGPHAVALEFAIQSMDACRAALAQGGVKVAFDGGLARIDADQACGVAIAMAPRGAADA